METVNIHEAKTHLSRLLQRAALGESFIIAKAGQPIAKVVPYSSPGRTKPKRLGFLAGRIRVPADFVKLGQHDIDAMFGGEA